MNLSAIRESLELSQIGLDAKAKLPKGTVHDLETKRNQNPSVRVALRLAKTLGVTVERLFKEYAA